jgi:hypothetical protein
MEALHVGRQKPVDVNIALDGREAHGHLFYGIHIKSIINQDKNARFVCLKALTMRGVLLQKDTLAPPASAHAW